MSNRFRHALTAQLGLLNDVLRLRCTAEHAVSESEQNGPMLLEVLTGLLTCLPINRL